MVTSVRPAAPAAVGPLEFALDGPGLRYIRWNGAQVLAGLTVAVRDANWETVPARVVASSALAVPGGRGQRWTVRHDDGGVVFRWTGWLRAWSPGPGTAELTFELDGVAGNDFRANRIGLCLLHPMTLAGQPVQVLEPGGWTASRFPEAVSPGPPFTGFAALRYQVPGGATALISLDGGSFETEDQRNWTDASFKTYSPPLRLPFPRRVPAGERVRQVATIRITGPAAASVRPRGRPGPGSGLRPPGAAVHIRVGGPTRPGAAAAPCLPAIGIGLAPGAPRLSAGDRGLIRALQPRHLHALVDTADPAWRAALRHALAAAAALSCPADLEIVAADGPEIGLVAAELKQAAALHQAAGPGAPPGRTGPGRVFVYERASSQTTRQLAAAWSAAGADPGRPAGGSRANYAELNRARLPADLLGAVAFAVNPQVHATDDESVMETLAAQPVVTRCAISHAGGLPVIVGPITLRPRFNAVATGPARPQPAGVPPPDVDVRQATAFGAAWLAGSIAALAPTGAAALTYFETAGPRGLLAGAAPLPAGFPRPGAVYPAYYVLAQLAPLSGRPLIPAISDDPGSIAALAVAGPHGPVIMLANLRGRPVTVVTSGLTGALVTRLPSQPGAPGPPPDRERAAGRPGGLSIELSPWKVVAISAELTA